MDIKKESVLLTVKDVVKFAQVGRSFVYQEVAAGRFPKPVKLGRSVRWLKSEVLAWVQGKALNREAYTEGKEILDEAHESEMNDGGPAHPVCPAKWDTMYHGISIRDYFAAKAMQGWISTYPDDSDCVNVGTSTVAKFAYQMADAMIAAREAK
jgi:predicted DNA-binding transcriptional regulator AlpA